MALTNLGYNRLSYDDVLTQQIARAKQLFGEDIDTSDSTPLGKYIRLNCKDIADCFEILEQIYFARFPNSASGVSLDRLCVFAGISRNPATYAKHNVTFTGTAGESVPSGFEVSAGDLIFHTYDTLTIGAGGTVTGVVECETAGTVGNVVTGAIDTIVNPNLNVDSITHTGINTAGQDIESDINLRYRFNQSVSGAGAATAAAISGAISRVPLVDGVHIVENDTDSTANGIPAHSFECFVLAPQSQDNLIAEAIFSKKPLGIKSHGDVTVTVTDAAGVEHDVKFSRTTQVNVYITLTITTNNLFETDGATQIKDAIATYINQLKNGEDVYLASLYGYIYKAAGVVNVSELETSTDGITYAANDISIANDEVARITTTNITVVVDE